MGALNAFHAYLLSDRPGAAYAFAGAILGGTFAAIVALVSVASWVL